MSTARTWIYLTVIAVTGCSDGGGPDDVPFSRGEHSQQTSHGYLYESYLESDGIHSQGRRCDLNDGGHVVSCSNWQRWELSSIASRVGATKFRGFGSYSLDEGGEAWLTQSLYDDDGMTGYWRRCPLYAGVVQWGACEDSWNTSPLNGLGFGKLAGYSSFLTKSIAKGNLSYAGKRGLLRQSLIPDDQLLRHRICASDGEGTMQWNSCDSWSELPTSSIPGIEGRKLIGAGAYSYQPDGSQSLYQRLLADDGVTEFSRQCAIVEDGRVNWNACTGFDKRDLLSMPWDKSTGFSGGFLDYGATYLRYDGGSGQPVDPAGPTEPPLSPSGGSKLGVHFLAGGSNNACGQKFIDACPAVIKLLDGEFHNIGAIRQECPQSSIVLRVFVPHANGGGPKYTAGQNPASAATDFYNRIASKLDGVSASGIWLEGPNELDNFADWYHDWSEANFIAQFWSHLADKIHNRGFMPLVGSIAVGNPYLKSDTGMNVNFMQPLADVMKQKSYAIGWAYHAYSDNLHQTTGGQEHYTSLRYRVIRDEVGLQSFPLILSEGGQDNCVDDGEDDAGWRKKFNDSQYLGWLDWFNDRMKEDSDVYGLTIFQAGNTSDWNAFDICPIADSLAARMGDDGTQTQPPPPPPPPPPSGTSFGYPVGDKSSFPAGGWQVWQVLAHHWGAYGGNHLAEDVSVSGGIGAINAPVFSVADGTVLYAKANNTSYRNVVLIHHDLGDAGSVCSFYAHINTPSVAAGQFVPRGQQIATVMDWAEAAGGASSNTHLHYVLLSEAYCNHAASTGTANFSGSGVCGYDKGGDMGVGWADVNAAPTSYTPVNDVCGASQFTHGLLAPSKFIQGHP